HVEHLTGDPCCSIGQQEQARTDHVVGRTQPFEGHSRNEIVCGVAGLSTGCCGIGGAGRDRVHPDVHTTQFVCQLLRQPVHSRLGQTVKTGIEPRCGRTLVHDRTATTLLHVRVHRTSDDKRTVHIHVHEPAVVLPIHGNQQVELHVTVD